MLFPIKFSIFDCCQKLMMPKNNNTEDEESLLYVPHPHRDMIEYSDDADKDDVTNLLKTNMELYRFIVHDDNYTSAYEFILSISELVDENHVQQLLWNYLENFPKNQKITLIIQNSKGKVTGTIVNDSFGFWDDYKMIISGLLK